MSYRAVGWLAVAGLVAGALVGPTIGTASAASFNGAIWTSLADGSSVNANIYANKGDVYLNGGPQNCGNGNGLPNGDYYDGGNGVISGPALLEHYIPGTTLDEMLDFDFARLDKWSYSLKRTYPI